VAIVALLLLVASPTAAQTGASDNRVSLPDGPGSIEGIGDDVTVTGNMGAMTYGVSMQTPPGFAGVTPDLGLIYSSAAGPGEAGVGWSLPVQSIERLTLRGVPDYDLDDEFTADGAQLVYVRGTNPREYRSRFEGSFVRYRWYDARSGGGGYWTAEYPDGRVGTFGAVEGGAPVDAARVGGADGVFRYLLVDLVDVAGHRLHHTYRDTGATSLLEAMEWGDVDGAARYAVELEWEPRADVVIDATGGFVERIEHRLASVETFADDETVDRWALEYEPFEASGGFSRLRSVHRTGQGGTPYPVAATFAYSSALGSVCDGATCERPFVRSLGSIGVNLATGDPQLIDINGDALPDIVDSTITGAPHRIFLNTMTADGRHSFDEHRDSTVGRQDAFDFSNPRVQVLDVDGDGFTDAANLATGQILRNEGTGDWVGLDTVDSAVLPDLANPALLATTRFVDIDNDRRIDLLRATGSGGAHTTQIYRNTGDGFVALRDVEPLGRGFDSGTLEVNDFNGDGLVDAAQITGSGVHYRLNTGHGRWWPSDGTWAFAPFDDAGLRAGQTAPAELEDLNGDGMADVVLVEGATVRVWLNRGGQTLEAYGALTDDDVDHVDGATIPSNTATTTVLFADVNANGSSDVVWVTASGDVTALELFPTRSNLLATVDNGLGITMHVEYGTSVEQRVRDAGTEREWVHPLPFANLVVTATHTEDGTSGTGWRTEYAYHGGFYDGVEKQFRGYETVVTTQIGDETQGSAMTSEVWTLGVDDPALAGFSVDRATYDDAGALLLRVETELAECATDVSGLETRWPIRSTCPAEVRTTIADGAPESAWRVVRERYRFDTYGNVAEQIRDGVIEVGGSTTCAPCDRPDGTYGAPCGAGCLGDERVDVTTYVEPGDATDGAWLLRLPARMVSYGDVARTDRVAESVFYYDGPAFEGLDEGEATRGWMSRTREWVADDQWIETTRVERDAHGNIVESRAPEHRAGTPGHRTMYTYDASGLFRQSERREIDGDTTLRQDFDHEPARGRVTEVGGLYREGTADARYATYATYDPFGRIAARVLPGGDTFASPSVRYRYALAPGVSSVTIETKRDPRGPWHAAQVVCVDGYGRPVQTRTALDEGAYLVEGHVWFGRRGLPVAEADAYESDGAACGTEVPADVPETRWVYDALGRPVRAATFVDDVAHRAIAFGWAPHEAVQFDSLDLDPEHPNHDTPITRRVDGLGRLVAVERAAGDGADRFVVGYDGAGRIAAITDPVGATRTWSYDGLGRVVSAFDIDRGPLSWAWDDNGNLVAKSDATGTIRYAWDGADREIERWVDSDRDATLQQRVWDAHDDCPSARCTFAAGRPVMERAPSARGAITRWSGYGPLGSQVWTQLDVPTDDGRARPLVQTRAWDLTGVLQREVTPGGLERVYLRDRAARVVRIPGFLEAARWEAGGEIGIWTGENGAAVRFGRDSMRRWTHWSLAVDDRPPLLEQTVILDEADRALEVIEVGSATDRINASARFEYDAFDRLVGADFDAGTQGPETLAWTYDAVDNVLEQRSSLGAESAAHDVDRAVAAPGSRRPSRVAGAELTWDGAGRLQARGSRTTRWDGFGDLAGIEAGGDDTRFDSLFGQGVVSTSARGSTNVWFDDDFEIRDGVAVARVRLGGTIVAERQWPLPILAADIAPSDGGGPPGDGEVRASDAWVAAACLRGWIALNDGACPADEAAVGRALTASASAEVIDRGEVTFWHHRDRLGSLRAVTDASGDVVEQTAYYPYGSVRASSQNIATSRGFTGAITGPSGTLLYPMRAYDPDMGRWLSPDTAFETLTPAMLERPWEACGTYSYVSNAPTLYTDPSGAVGLFGSAAPEATVFDPSTVQARSFISFVSQDPPAPVRRVDAASPYASLAAASVDADRPSMRVFNGPLPPPPPEVFQGPLPPPPATVGVMDVDVNTGQPVRPVWDPMQRGQFEVARVDRPTAYSQLHRQHQARVQNAMPRFEYDAFDPSFSLDSSSGSASARSGGTRRQRLMRTLQRLARAALRLRR